MEKRICPTSPILIIIAICGNGDGMQGYGQPGGANYQQPPPPPPYGYQGQPKKKGLALIIVGLIILIVGLIGVVASAFLITEAADAKSMSEIADDYDENSMTFDSYDDGDKIVIKGEITDEEENFGSYKYIIDDESGILILSEDDRGDVGDTVIFSCEVDSLLGMDYLVVKSKMSGEEGSGPICMAVSVIGLIVGIVIALLGFRQRKQSSSVAYMPPPPPQQQPPPQYSYNQPQQDPYSQQQQDPYGQKQQDPYGQQQQDPYNRY